MEDYAIMKAGEVPDSMKKQIQANLETPNSNMGSGVMIGSSTNDLFGQGLRNTPTLGMGNNSMNSGMTGGGSFGNNTLNRSASPWPNTGGTNNTLFPSQGSFSSNNALPSFGQRTKVIDIHINIPKRHRATTS